ncbi:hypothetical protein Y88_0752 [Novosphingobium nitrogenifigens DSM 19370]|uniref:Uncharacterized protein n=1 Tax=Novosphingobium nitrogenifigens DSM 19370 TaxID=983920 RepID=F1Z9P7_9SPHN|nr:hypothetical protein Y88_0752 [Novosphingobium nitrogenifigens DSM 19370]
MKARIACALGKHAPDRNKVRQEGNLWLGHCRHCGAPIAKRNGYPWKVRT